MTEDQREEVQPSYQLTQIPFTDKTGKPFHMDYIVTASTIGEAMGEEAVKSRIDAIRVVSDRVYPPTRNGGPMHEAHEKYVASWPRFATVVDEETQEIVGFHFFGVGTLEGTNFQVLDIHAAGIDPSYQHRGLMERSRQKLLDQEHPDIIFGTTIHPGVYNTYRRLGKDNRLIFFPQSEKTPTWMIALAKKVARQFGSEESAAKLDGQMVKRYHLPMPVQGEVPYEGFKFFERTLHVRPIDGVMMVLLKPEVATWAKREFEEPLVRRLVRQLSWKK